MTIFEVILIKIKQISDLTFPLNSPLPIVTSVGGTLNVTYRKKYLYP